MNLVSISTSFAFACECIIHVFHHRTQFICGYGYETFMAFKLIKRRASFGLLFNSGERHNFQCKKCRMGATYPCAACKIEKKKCGDKCMFAPYFSSENPQRFLTVRRVFGAGNLSRMLENIPVEKREDAVNSIVYEANARVSDPINGCAGKVFELEKKLVDLQSQLAVAEEELLTARANLVSLADINPPPLEDYENCEELILSDDLQDPFGLWEPL